MGTLLDQLSSNPLYLVIAALLAIVLVVVIVKKAMKLTFILAIAVIAFAGYLQFTGREIPTIADDIKSSATKQFDKIKDSGNEALEDLLKSAKNEFSKKLKE